MSENERAKTWCFLMMGALLRLLYVIGSADAQDQPTKVPEEFMRSTGEDADRVFVSCEYEADEWLCFETCEQEREFFESLCDTFEPDSDRERQCLLGAELTEEACEFENPTEELER